MGRLGRGFTGNVAGFGGKGEEETRQAEGSLMQTPGSS